MPVPPDSSSAPAPAGSASAGSAAPDASASSAQPEPTSASGAASGPASPALLLQVKETRYALLSLHKKLLDAERVRYERVNGRVPGPGALLQLVLNDPWFAWLRPISTLVVQIDERMDADAPVQTVEAESMLSQARAVVEANGGAAASSAGTGNDTSAGAGIGSVAGSDDDGRAGADVDAGTSEDAVRPEEASTPTAMAAGFQAKYQSVAAESAEVRQAYATLLSRLEGGAA